MVGKNLVGDVVGQGVESFAETKDQAWPGWKGKIRATKSRPVSSLPPIKERWRFVPPFVAPVRLSARFLAVLARETGTWSTSAEIFLPTLCALQYGFKPLSAQ
jgi:hypothetical protein